MKDRISQLTGLQDNGYWKDRITSEMDYLRLLSSEENGSYDSLIEQAIAELSAAQKANGVFGRDAVLSAEEILMPAAESAKAFNLLCVSHAHIDMNWMWGWHETVAVTLETFRTILTLMQEYPDFTFAQSQASVYSIVEEYEPAMLDEIRARVAEGRWEVTASQWVEGDKNLPGGEALMRHLLYAREYLSDLLSIPKDQLNIDFEPDTFGHNANMPEILSTAGVKYYYHCRGSNDRIVYRWFSPSGASVIAYQEPRWYNSTILPNLAEFVPGFCSEFKTNTALAVYGVGDHGGGPTRRDIERIIDMQSWPIYPSLRFGSYGEFFAALENADLPEIHDERNFIFVGCYTSQTRIKMANRLAEAGLNEAERFSSIALAEGLTTYDAGRFAKAWQDTLFNHFHDILPGSGVTETREYALGKFQDTMATALSRKTQALRAIAEAVDTDQFSTDTAGRASTVSEGAGVGFGLSGYQISRTERGAGDSRVFVVFNPSPYTRTNCVELVVWDWTSEKGIEVSDKDGRKLPAQIMDSGTDNYWGHKYTSLIVETTVPGIGYTTICVSPGSESKNSYLDNPLRTASNLVHAPVEPVLENDSVRIEFDARELRIVSFYDKALNRELIDRTKGGACFRLITEEGDKTWTAWVVGRIIEKTELVDNAHMTGHCLDGTVTRWIEYRVAFASSEMKVRFQLNSGSHSLSVHCSVRWRELGSVEKGVPQLDFQIAHTPKCGSYTYDIPFGTIDRAPSIQDRPAVSWAAAPEAHLLAVAREKNGFRGDGTGLYLPLIRATTAPDPYPEIGDHDISFWISSSDWAHCGGMIDEAQQLLNPLTPVSTRISGGTLPAESSVISLSSDTVKLAAIKKAEKSESLVIRLYECTGTEGTATIDCRYKIIGAAMVDADENRIETAARPVVTEKAVEVRIPPYSVRSLCVEFAGNDR